MRKLVNHRISVTVNKESYENFENVYPNCLSKFIRNAIKLALINKEFFMQIFFYGGNN